MASFLAHVDAGVECADGPDGRHPREHKSPALGPGCEVLRVSEDICSRVDLSPADGFTDGQGEDSGQDEADVAHDTGGLDFGHDARAEDGDEAVDDDAGDVSAV